MFHHAIVRAARPVFAAVALLAAAPVWAQVQTVDPDKAIDSDLMPAPGTAAPVAAPPPAAPVPAEAPAAAPVASEAALSDGQTYNKDELVGAAEGLFGKGARGLAEVFEDLLKKQGRPNGYIVGREGGGAFLLGVRYGAGKLYHKVEGQQQVYWTGPSFGLDAGANAGDTFVLVYNLYDTADLFRRFAAGEGQAYLVGGFHVSYLRYGDIVLIPVRAGAGVRLGINVGYMKFNRKRRYSPF